MTIDAYAAAPSRATTSFTLAFGILNIPLSVYTGTEQTRVSRKEFFDGDPTIPVGRSPIRRDNGEVIESDKVVRMAEASTGAWVVLTDDEIAACTMPKGVADIVSFVPVKEAGAYLAEDQVQVRPKSSKGVADPAGEKAFALLLTAMKRKKVCALVKVALRGPARYGLLHDDGSLVYVRTADQVREARPLNDGFKFSPQELKLAEALVEAVGVEAPVVTDDTAPAVRAYVEAKAKGVTPTTVVTPSVTPVDLMAALSASIDAKKGKVA